MKSKLFSAMLVFAVFVPSTANAFDWSVVGKVTYVEPSYAPNQLPFMLDKGVSSCPAGATLSWNPQGTDEPAKIANYNAVLATLLTAKSTGQNVEIFGENNGCTIDYIHIR